jgi:hypothetical protein
VEKFVDGFSGSRINIQCRKAGWFGLDLPFKDDAIALSCRVDFQNCRCFAQKHPKQSSF